MKQAGEYKLQHIAIDVRRNQGGNSNVVGEFLKYLDIDRYRSYQGSKELVEQRSHSKSFGYRYGTPTRVQNHKTDA